MNAVFSSCQVVRLFRKALLCGVGCVSLAGCMVGPRYHPPTNIAPAHFEPARKGRSPVAGGQSVVREVSFDQDWWTQFRDPELASLEERVAVQNLSFQLATANLAQSRAQMMIAGAERFPSLAAQGSYRRSQYSTKQFQEIVHRIGKKAPGGMQPDTILGNAGLGRAEDLKVPLFNQWQDSIDATYEVDIWGRVARQYQAAKALMQMTEEERRGILIARQAEMARDYLQLRGDQKRRRILAGQHETLTRFLALTQSRYHTGLVTDLDVESVKARLHEIEAQQARLDQGVAQEMNAVALLLGAPPRSLDDELRQTASIPAVPPIVPIGLPSELAHRRPDVREAEARLRQAVAEVGEATADFYPKVTINADFGFQTLSFRDLGFWNARAWNVGPSISLPIFQGGRLYGQLKLKKAAQKSAAISYRQTVLQAWHEVDNALQAYHDEQNRRRGLQQTVDDQKRAFHLVTSQYRSGLVPYLNVLDTQTRLQTAEMDLAESDATLATDMARLYNTLGGGWQDVLPEHIPDQPHSIRYSPVRRKE